jgi:hypothetical protein
VCLSRKAQHLGRHAASRKPAPQFPVRAAADRSGAREWHCLRRLAVRITWAMRAFRFSLPAAAVLLLALPLAASAQPSASAARTCTGTFGGGFVSGLEASGVSCATARSVVRGYMDESEFSDGSKRVSFKGHP